MEFLQKVGSSGIFFKRWGGGGGGGLMGNMYWKYSKGPLYLPLDRGSPDPVLYHIGPPSPVQGCKEEKPGVVHQGGELLELVGLVEWVTDI